MKRLKKVFGSIIIIVLSLLIILNLYNFFCMKVLKKDYTSIMGYTMLEVISGSMEPTIHVNDFIIVNTREREFHENDIITFYDEENSFVTHRIISVEENNFITKGDNNDSIDKPISKDQIFGKYVLKFTGAGKILGAFKNPITMVLIFIVGVLACIFISTDKNGNPIIDEDEKEFEEFIKNKDKKGETNKISKKENNKKSENKKEIKKKTTKKSTIKKTETKQISKTSSTKKTTTSKKDSTTKQTKAKGNKKGTTKK